MKHIIIFLLALMPLTTIAQIAVKGVIKDGVDETLPGSGIVEVGNPKNGTVADFNGAFTLKVASKDAKIKVTALGFKEQTLTVSEEMVVVMDEDTHMLKEVGVVRQGFGSKTRITNIAAVSQVSGEQLRQSPTTSLQNSLAGRVPGLFQIQGSGQPGKDAAEILLRGAGTYATGIDKSPLVLIDDVESTIETLSQLSSNEVEDVSILKDAGSTAIFGLKGANGVILITTRRGHLGAPKLTFRADVGFQQPTYKNKFLGAYESLNLIKEMFQNDGSIAELEAHWFKDETLEHYKSGDSPYLYPNTNWYDLMYKKASMLQQYSMDVQGGSDKVKYFVSLGYVKQDGLLKEVKKEQDFDNDYFLKRYNIRSNFDISITKDFTAKISANAILSEINEPHLPNPGEAGDFSIFARLLGGRLDSWKYPAYNPDGTFGMHTEGSMNPLALLAQGGYKREYKNNINGNISLEHKLDFITKGLLVRGQLALTNTWAAKRELKRGADDFLAYYYDKSNERYLPINNDVYILRPMSATETRIDPYVQINTRFDLAYNRRFGVHNVGALILASWYSNRKGAEQPTNSLAISGRINYDYNSRYLIEFNGTYNGSDKFHKDNRYDLFPSISVGWNLAEEPYLKDYAKLARIEMFKLKATYGIVGSDLVKDNVYTYIEMYKKAYDYPFGENASQPKIPAYFLENIANEKVKWEEDRKLNLGAELRLFDGRLAVEVDYFYNKRSDILTKPLSLPLYMGYLDSTLPVMNIGKTTNKGWETSFVWRDKISKDFNYFTRLITTYAKSKITYMDEAPSLHVLSMATGRPIGTLFGYVADGFYNTQEEIDNGAFDALRDGKAAPGDLKYKDISGPNGVPDGIISEYDKVAIGNNRPDFTYGIAFGFTYKNLDVSTLFQGATGAKLSVEQVLRIGGTDGRPRPIHRGRWSSCDTEGNIITDLQELIDRNKNASFPILSKNNGRNTELSTFWLRSANYLRWKNLEVGYTFPKQWTQKIGVSALRLYSTMENLITWSDLSDYQVDPESSTKANPLDTYPQQRIYNFGCRITF